MRLVKDITVKHLRIVGIMDKYDNLGIIGEGSYGVVIKCKHKQSGQVRQHHKGQEVFRKNYILFFKKGSVSSVQSCSKY